MQSDRIEITDPSTAETPGFNPYLSSFTPPSRDGEAAHESTPVGIFTLGIAWLFGLEALFGDERR